MPNSLTSSVRRSRNRQPQSAEDEVVLHGLAGLLHGDVWVLGVLVLALVADLDRVALGRAVDEVLGDERLRLAAADRALPEHGDRTAELDLDDGALARVDEEVGDRAGRDARDLDLGAVGEAEGVVHLDVVRVRVVAGRRRRHDRRHGGRDEGEDERDPPHVTAPAG